MGDKTTIEYLQPNGKTFSPWIGCAKVSPGCEYCWAEAWAKRTGFIKRRECDWRPGGKRKRTSEAAWRQPLLWNKRAAERGERYRILPGLCDPFDGAAPQHWLEEFLQLIDNTPNLDWLVLTKRPRAALAVLSERPDVLNNLWLGCSICNQKEANEKIPILLKIPAKVHWLSCEPLLEWIDLKLNRNKINWLVAGCSSATRQQPAHADWFRDLRNQCNIFGNIPFFLKQMVVDGKLTSMPLLDGRKWEQYPV